MDEAMAQAVDIGENDVSLIASYTADAQLHVLALMLMSSPFLIQSWLLNT